MIRVTALSIALAVGLLSLWGTLESTRAQESGVIEGQVLNATPGGEAVGAIPLLVQRWRGQSNQEGVPDVSLALEAENLISSDDQGRFRIGGLESASNIRYIIQAGFQDVAYRTGPIRVDQGPASVEITVFETTTDDRDISIRRASIAIPTVDAGQGLVGILELLSFVNAGDRTYVGDLGSDSEQSGVVWIPLPANALDINLGHGFGPDGFTTFDGGVINRAPLLPGETEMIIAYAIPYAETQAFMKKRYLYRVDSMSVLIPEELGRVSSPHLDMIGPVSIDGIPNLLLNGGTIPPGQEVSLTISDLPRFAIPGGDGPSMEAILRIAVIALIAAAAIAIVQYARVQRGQHRALAKASIHLQNSLEDERQALVLNIAQLDADLEAGHIAHADHERLRDQRKQRLIDVLQLLQQQDSAGSPQ